MDSYEIVVRIALIYAHGTECPADHGIKKEHFFQGFLVSPPERQGGMGGKGKVFC